MDLDATAMSKHYKFSLFLIFGLLVSCERGPVNGNIDRVRRAIRATVTARSVCIDKTFEKDSCRVNYQLPRTTLMTGESQTLLYKNAIYRKDFGRWTHLADVDFVKPVSITALEAVAEKADFSATAISDEFKLTFLNVDGLKYEGFLWLAAGTFEHVSRFRMTKEDGSEGFDVTFTRIGSAPPIPLPG